MPQRIVAFLDVLGFKSLVETVPQSELVEIYGRLQLAARQHTTSPVFPDDHRRFDADAFYADDEVQRRRVVNIVMASDSVVAYSAGDDYTDALAVSAAVRGLLGAGFRNGVPLRGAIAIGELDEIHLDDNTLNGGNWTARFKGLVGLALVRAYELEHRCQWSGAIVHPDLIAHLDEEVLGEHEDGDLTALDVCSSHLLVETDAPIKGVGTNGGPQIAHERQWAVNWPFLSNSVDLSFSETQVAESFASFGRATLSADVEAKRDETLAFMRRAHVDSRETFERRFKR